MTPDTSRIRLLTGLPILLAAASCVPSASALSVPQAANADTDVRAAPPPPDAALQKSLWLGPAPVFTAPSRAPALPFDGEAESDGDRLRSLDCLTAAVYHEARSESGDGQRAVAQVVLNRVRHPGFPASVCGVVYQGSARRTGCQFSFTCDGSLARRIEPSAWDRARGIAADALAGAVFAPVGNATHYHTAAILPYWASSLTRAAIVGAHIFYRWNGSQGSRAAFRQAYAGIEPDRRFGESTASAPVIHIGIPDGLAKAAGWREKQGDVVVHHGDGLPEEAAATIPGVRVHVGTLPATLG